MGFVTVELQVKDYQEHCKELSLISQTSVKCKSSVFFLEFRMCFLENLLCFKDLWKQIVAEQQHLRPNSGRNRPPSEAANGGSIKQQTLRSRAGVAESFK